ncbi:MAG: patatin-like phospholipase family protein, partial [Limisphaerales bacterium]
MRICQHGLLASLVGVLVVAATGCKSLYTSVNRPLQAGRLAPDCRATFEIQQPRGEKDVLVVLCLSGGGSRAAWFSAATMLRLEKVEDEINLLHEVDVISSVSGGSLPAAYYCLSRDPGPYSVIRVEQLPERLPVELVATVKMDRQHGLLGVSGKMSPEQRNHLLTLFASPHDQECVERLYWLSHHNQAPVVWEPDKVRALMTRNYISQLLEASFSPLNLYDDWLYWTTAFNRS